MKAHRRLYLERYAAPETAAAPALAREYESVLVIPAFDEPEDFLARTLPPGARDVLVVLVANVPDRVARTNPAVDRTRRLGGLAGRFDAARNIDVVVIDRVETPIPARLGVGLARRIGADVALRYIDEGGIARPVVFCTDADAALPSGYLDAPREGGEAGAWVYPFAHVSDDPALREAGLGYELSLRYYVNRLAYAGSPYAFHTIGSCLAIDATAYAMVRGFPKRNAAEDFYLLNKLAKTGSVWRLAHPVIEIEARASQRVPFGTGPALARAPEALESRMDYAPATFELLRSLYEQASRGTFTEWPEPIPELLVAVGYARFRPSRWDRRAFHTWFDALKTLRFVHAARRWFPDVPLVDSLRSLYPAAAGPRAWNDALRADEQRRRGVVGVAPAGAGDGGLLK
ncbi:MAG: hypothetical protein F4X99_11195 [Gammaproteobacteria bacterium]|nr:hypothetical protein [Gammaproteobacteria bacterium]